MTIEPDWLDEVISLARKAWKLASPSRTRKIATALPVHDAPGWYQVDGRLWPNDLEYISEGNLTYGSGDRALTFDVLEVAIDGDQVRVRVSGTAPLERLSLWIRRTDTRRILAGLGKGLKASRANPLLAQFGERWLTAVQPAAALADARSWPGLRAAQRDAVAACCSPGLQMVWGPPGTGKTFVIAASIGHLVASGQRVLLVSNNNMAVDTALHDALPSLGPLDQGQAVRVGNIVLPALAADDRVRLDRLVESRQSEQQANVDRLAGRLKDLVRASTLLAEAETQLTGFDPDAYQQAAARVENRRRFDQVSSAISTAQDRLNQANLELGICEQQELSLACCEAVEREAEIRKNLAEVDAALADYHEASRMTRSLHLGLKGRLTANRVDLANELASAEAVRRRTITAAREAGADPAPSNRPDAVQTTAAVAKSRSGVALAEARLTRLHEDADRLTRAGLSASSDEALVASGRERWALHRDLPALRSRAQEEQGQRAAIQREYDEATERLRKAKRVIEQEIVSGARLVATTLTQLASRVSLAQVRFDHVIVDEAAAAPLPHIAHAVGYARIGATLVGDYLQNGPIVDRDFPGDDEIQELFKQNCFSFFGATEPRQTLQMAGCVVLTEQFRFGPALNELANRVAYEGILTAAGRGASDIVVVTVDGLPEVIRTIHRERKQAGWWLIGALLARALAEHHNDAGARDAFGVVVPYVDQEAVTRAALDDSALARATPVGTAHRFQGRQFDTVLADLVEDGWGRIARANRHGSDYDTESVRLFNVAATRARSRLYVLVGRRPLEKDKNGPLAALRSMVETGQARRVDADSLLGMFGTEPPPPGTPEADLVAALDPYVRVAGIYDEDAAIEEVIARIDDAHSSVWCWSAWVGRYADDVTDALYRAHHRGISVHVMSRPEHEVQGSNRQSLQKLVTRMPRVIFIQKMHQKIVIVDEQWSIIGSMNMLSHGQTSANRIRDVMVTMDGARFAGRLLAEEHADEFRQIRQCPTCSQVLTECGLVGSGRDRGWGWLCTADRSHRLAFPGASARSGQGRKDRHP